MGGHWERVAGAAAAAAGVAGLGIALLRHPTLGRSLLFGLTLVLLDVAAYVVAAWSGRRRIADGGIGMLIGINAGAVGGIAWRLLDAVAPAPVAVPVGLVLGLFVLAGAAPALAGTAAYQRALGPANLLLPTSWPVEAAGLLLLAATASARAFGGKHAFHTRFDRGTGTLFVVGGIVGDHIPRGSTGFNMGNVAFVRGDAGDLEYLLHHETGHTLNLSAFGSAFHAIGGLDENVRPRGTGAAALAEKLAESHVPTGQRGLRQIVRLWGW